MQDAAPVKSGGSDDAQSLAKDSIARWAKLWRSLLLSSIGKAAYPYCRYIRVLDLNDLGLLLQEPRFRNEYSKSFFSGDLTPFLIEQGTPVKVTRGSQPRRFNDGAMLEKIGESISSKAPMVEELIAGHYLGEISKEALVEWIPRMRQLRHLQLFDGLKATGLGTLLRDCCPHFRVLRFYTASHGADTAISQLLDDLNPNTLQALEIFSSAQIEDKVFSSLGRHARSLTELKLGEVERSCLSNLSKMSSCSSLRSLQLKVSKRAGNPPDLEAQIPEIVQWLQSCKNLQELAFEDFDASVQILTPLMLNPSTKLTSLSVLNYDASTANDFHSALPHQSKSLHSLVLRSVDDSCNHEILVAALTQLSILKDLRLQGVSDYFFDNHIRSLAENLPYLEDIWISGWRITDAVWSSISMLGSLRRLELNAFSAFTTDGILDFVSNLGPGNHGLSLAIMMADPASEMGEAEQGLIRDSLMEAVEGRFEYQLARDPDAVEYDSSDSD